MGYSSDRSFTDFVHEKLAIPIIYSKLNWICDNEKSNYKNERDLKDEIDYQAIDSNDFKITIQERFRDEYYSKYNDFTIRYSREHSKRKGEQKSEYYKLNADYFIYGITNGKKFPDKRYTVTNFKKFIVFDVNMLRNLFRKSILRIPIEFNTPNKIINENGMKFINVTKKRNTDNSSEFIAIDPKILKTLIGNEIDNIVIYQSGFY